MYLSTSFFSYPFLFISQVASLIGSSSVLFCGVVSNNMEDFLAFQAFTVLIAILSCGCMLYTGFHSESRFDNKASQSDAPASVDQTSHPLACSFSTLKTLTWQILTNRDFQLFVLMNFFQVFMLAFFNNFTMIFTEHLIPPDVLPSLAKSIMYGAAFICPQVSSHSVSVLVFFPIKIRINALKYHTDCFSPLKSHVLNSEVQRSFSVDIYCWLHW